MGMGGIAAWAGVECTVNRVGDRYGDQLVLTGHASRVDDIALVASLGVKAVRYPVLWERVAPDGLASADWSWSDERLGKIRDFGMEPVVGLLHHGSGPRQTSLLDPSFPEQLAEFAGAVARRYPWVRKFTPVNEPVTTARFSGLYGHWYPHHKDDPSFARMVVNQCRAVVLAMAAIREHTPDAELVQTDDGGRTFARRPLEYQAAFENDRRWLTFDLLTGRIDPAHPLWAYLTGMGQIRPDELHWFARRPCPPSIIGLNYYLTSDRHLDHCVDAYPRAMWGGNGFHEYVDLEAVRIRAEGIYGHRALLWEAWRRYRLPVAVTEVHLGCTREDQLRWLMEAWHGAVAARRMGADVRAVTAWSVFGATDWDTLVTSNAGHYEPGVFDVRAPTPRATALAGALRELASGKQPSHPVLALRGWWRRPSRINAGSARARGPASIGSRAVARPIVIVGASGTLGTALARACAARGLEHRLLGREQMDIADSASVRGALTRYRPWAVVNAAGFVRVDEAERDAAACRRENTAGPAELASFCRENDIALLTYSSDLVFDGRKSAPYVESDSPRPLSIYGESKADAETRVLAEMPRALVIRTSAFFGPWDDHNFVTLALRTLREGRTFTAARDVTVSPTYVPDLATASLDLLIDGEEGLWHLANDGASSWAALARGAARAAGFDESRVIAVDADDLGWVARRPSYCVLGSERGAIMPPLTDALRRYASERASFEAARAQDLVRRRSARR